jgi:hypothetical protein
VNITYVGDIPAGASINIMTGQQYEFMPFDAQVQIGLNAAAVGLVATIFAGPDLVQQEGPCNVKSTFPSVSDDLYIDENVRASTRLSINVRNTTGAAITLRALVRLLQLQ